MACNLCQGEAKFQGDTNAFQKAQQHNKTQINNIKQALVSYTGHWTVKEQINERKNKYSFDISCDFE